MLIRLISPGQRMPSWVAEGFNEYARRLPPSCALELVEIPLSKRRAPAELKRRLEEEGTKTLAALPQGAYVVALDERGRQWDSVQFSRQLDKWLQQGRDVALLMGGPDGLAPACRERAEQTWALSPLTLPHMLARIVAAEQIYRAWTLLSHHPYHRS